jgi:hypothetical protein
MKEVYETPVAEVVSFTAMENIALIEHDADKKGGTVTDGNQSEFEW